MSYILNIGLPSFYDGDEVDTILNAARCAGLTVQHFEVQGPRLVASVDTFKADANAHPSVYHMARALGRDCIAVYHTGMHTGELVGPKAATWGEFDVYKFRFPQEVAA
jgi:hypothetical protein